MTEVIDRVQFIMPVDRELQCVAMTILQAYVSGYEARAQAQDPSLGEIRRRLVYSVRMKQEDAEYFARFGMALDHPPEALQGTPDCVVDMSDDRLNLFQGTGKNVWQIANLLAGTQTDQILLKVRGVRPRIDYPLWVDAGIISGLDRVKDGEITGVFGMAGPVTYMASAMGLGVVEILPVGRPSYWLSKWATPYYRLIPELAGDRQGAVGRAMQDIELLMSHAAKVQK